MNLNSNVPASPTPSVIGSVNPGTSTQVPFSFTSRVKGDVICCDAETGAAIGASAEISIIRQMLRLLVLRTLYM